MSSTRLALSTVLWLVCMSGLCAAATDDLAKEVAKRETELAKAKQVFEAAVAEVDGRALKAYLRIAQRSAKDLEGAGAAWTEVLRLDRKHPEAVAWFIKQGTLEAVLADLDHPTDLLGNQLGGSDRLQPGRAVLVIGANASLVPVGVRTLTESFAARTTELVVGAVTGDGVLFEEGASGNGQAIGVVADEIHYVVRTGGMPISIKAPFDRTVPWTQVVVQFDGGALSLWLNGKRVAKGDAGFTTIPAHAGGGIARGDGGNSGGWTDNCQFLLASLRLSNRARYSDKIRPDGTMEPDADTVLALTPEAIAAELTLLRTTSTTKPSEIILLQRVDRMPPGNISWTATGMVGVR